MENSRYDWDGKSLYALDRRTGEEVIYAQCDQVTIREATIEDIKRRIFKAEGMKEIIKIVMRSKGITRKQAEAHLELRLKNAFRQREKDYFGIEYIIEVDGEFVCYAEMTSYGYEPEIDGDKKSKKIFIGDKSYQNEDTYAGVDFFFVNQKAEEKHLQQICLALGHLCSKYGFFDHLDLIKLSTGIDPITKEEVRQIKIFGTLYDYAA